MVFPDSFYEFYIVIVFVFFIFLSFSESYCILMFYMILLYYDLIKNFFN